jgi:hypothetical protein
MKRLLLAVLLLLALAVPAWAVARTLNWTDAGADEDWTTLTNWIDVATGIAPLLPPVTGDTVQFLDGDVLLPASNLPNAGEVFVLVIDGASAGTAWTSKGLTDFCGALNWKYSALTVGAEGRNNDSITLDRDSDGAPNTITVWGYAYSDGVPTPIANATITVKSGGMLYDGTTNWAITQPITVETGGMLGAAGTTLFANGGVNLAGTLHIGLPSSVLDGFVTATGNCTIDWGSGAGDILGGLNANGHTVTHDSAAAGNSITCDVAGTLDLGTTDPNEIAVEITANTTIGDSFACGTLTHTAGAITGAGKTITAPGGYTMSGTASIAGTLNVVCGAGAYTQTAGTIAAAAVLSVTTGSGGCAFTALTKTGKINITTGATSVAVSWNAGVATAIDVFTVGATTTQNNHLYALAIAGAGTLATGNFNTYFYPTAAGDWTYTGTTTGGIVVIIPQTTPRIMTNALGVGTRAVLLRPVGGDKTITFPGMTCGTLTVYSNEAAKTQTLILAGNSSGTGITLGSSTNLYGAVTFGAGYVHTWTGAIARGGTGTANAITFGGQVRLGGNVTLAGITTAFGDSKIDASSALTINGASAAGTTSGNCIVTGRGGLVTFSNMQTNFTGRPILARRYATDAGSVAAVQPAAPHWLTGVR